MSTLDTFFLSFKTDAKKAQAEVDDLDKQITKLAAKGTARNDQEGKQLKELRKRRAETLQDIKDQTKAVDTLGDSFTGVADSLGKLVVGYLGLSGLKGGMANAQKFTSSLEMQSKWLGINAKQLAAWDQAIQTVGGAPGEGSATITALHDSFVKMGFGASMPDLLKGLRQESKQYQDLVKQYGKDRARDIFEQQGMKQGLPKAAILFMMQDLSVVDDTIADMERLNRVTDEGTKTAREFDKAWVATTAHFQGLFAELNERVLPSLTKLMNSFNSPGGIIADQNNRGLIRRSIMKEKNIGWNDVSPGDIDAYIAAHKSPASSVAGDGSSTLGIRNNNPGNLQPGGVEATFATPERGLAAMAGNLRRYGRREWNSIDSIVSHWAPGNGVGNSPATEEAYKATIERMTGFGRGQKLNLDDPATLDALMNAMIHQENGKNPYSDSEIMRSIMLGKQALNSASQSPFNSSGSLTSSIGGDRSIVVKTGDVNIYTQAKSADDIAGAISTSLRNQLRMTVSNVDDGWLA